MNDQRKDLSSNIQNELTDYLKKIISALGDDPNRQALQKTPQRALESLRYLTRGYEVDMDDLMKDAFFTSEMDEMVVVKNIELYSLCEHHLLPFIGKCHLAYLPAGRVIGLSKMANIVDTYACRLQIQETLTKQIADCLQVVTQAKGVGVIIEAQHLCLMMRGAEKQNSWMKTSMMYGLFRSDPRTRSEFLKLVTT